MKQAMSTVDPITLSVLQNGLMQVCNEMDLAFVRSAFSPVIAEALDRSDGIYHRDTGELIAQGELGLPVFVGTMQFTVQAVIERVQRLKIALHPGDVFIVNDPYLGGTHLMDVKFVQPFFRDGRLWCWLANTGHWPDTGGMVPGGFSANATEVEQEGLRLPPVKLYKQGVLDDEILSIILSNIRIADQRIGDIKAQAAALATGEARLDALLDRYGDDTVDAAIAELKRRAERQMREKIATIADGVYEGEAFVDSDGVVDEPLRIAMRITRPAAATTPRRARVRHERVVAALPGADEQRHRDDQVVDLSRGQARLSGSGDQRRHVRAACTSSIPREPSSTRITRGRCRAAPPKSASASPKRCSPRSARRFPTSCSARRRERAAISASAASTRRRSAPT